jgi:autotransporter-associated beta strand protein
MSGAGRHGSERMWWCGGGAAGRMAGVRPERQLPSAAEVTPPPRRLDGLTIQACRLPHQRHPAPASHYCEETSMFQVIRGLRLHLMMSAVMVALLVVPNASAAIYEFDPVQPVANIPEPYNRLPPPQGIGFGVQIRDGFGGQNLPPGLDTTHPLVFNVDDVDTPITRVEVVLALYHPHLNDLDITLQSPSGITVPLIRGISFANAPITSRPVGGGYQYAGNIGGQFGVYGSPLTPITLVSELDEDDVLDGQVPFINDPTILDDDPQSVTYLNTVPPGTYYSQGDLRLFNGLAGDGSANGQWRLRVVDSKQNNFLIVDGSAQYVYYLQAVMYAQIIIHQQGGYKIWVGNGADNNWGTEENWDPITGEPDAAQPVSILFPSNPQNVGGRYTPVNNLANLRIAEIIITEGTQDYDITMGNVTFYKRSRIRNNRGTSTLTWTGAQLQDLGRLKVDVAEGQVTLNGFIGGEGGIKKIGRGLAVLNGNSTFTGTTIVDEGVLQLLNANSLGAAGLDNHTLIRDSGILRLGGLGQLTEPLILAGNGAGAGALHVTANQTISGRITLRASTTGAVVDAGTLTLNNFDPTVQSGLTGFTISGGGTVALAGVDAVFPVHTAVSVSGSTLTTNVEQPNLGNLVLNNATVTGTGALHPRDLNGFLPVSGAIVSSGTSSIANPIDLDASAQTINVGSGTLTTTATISDGSLSKAGGGSLLLNGASAGVPVSVGGGTLGGTGTIGNLSVVRGGALNPGPGGAFTAASATFGPQSAFIVDGAGDQLISAGAVSLGGDANGINGAVLQVYDTVPLPATIIAATTSGRFEGLPAGSPGITYNANSVVLNNAGDSGLTVWFDPSSYTVDESVGTMTVSAVWSGGPGTAVLRHFGGEAVRDRSLVIGLNDTGTPTGLTVRYTVTIPQNYVDTGDVTTTLALVPRNGARLASNPPAPGAPTASLIIIDDDKTDQQNCGFGTGLTVFLLLGMGLAVNLRQRRR